MHSEREKAKNGKKKETVEYPVGRFFAMTMGAQIPVIAEKPLAACGCKKFQLDVMGDHFCTCTAHSGDKKAHDWVVEKLGYLFHTTHHTKTEHVTKSRGRHCGDIQLAAYLANAVGPVPLVLDLLITHDRFGSHSDPSLNVHLHYPNDIDKSPNETSTDKIPKYRVDYANNPPSAVSFSFLQLQEFSLCKPTVVSSTSAAWRSQPP